MAPEDPEENDEGNDPEDDVEPAFDIDLDPEDQGTAAEAAENPD